MLISRRWSSENSTSKKKKIGPCKFECRHSQEQKCCSASLYFSLWQGEFIRALGYRQSSCSPDTAIGLLLTFKKLKSPSHDRSFPTISSGLAPQLELHLWKFHCSFCLPTWWWLIWWVSLWGPVTFNCTFLFEISPQAENTWVLCSPAWPGTGWWNLSHSGVQCY